MELDDTLVALADETRREILKRLAVGDARVTEVAAPFDISLNSVSKHIRILERAGLVRRRIAGRDISFRSTPRRSTRPPLDATRARRLDHPPRQAGSRAARGRRRRSGTHFFPQIPRKRKPRSKP